jgi:type I restriction enzyme S subunit
MTVQLVKLAECTTLTKGKPPAEIPYYGDDAEPYLSPEYLRGNGLAEPAKPAANAVRVKGGDTILLWDGSNAGEVFRARDGLLASTMTRIGHGEEFEPEYFCYAAKRWEAYLKGQTSGSGIPHVDKEVLGKLEILKLPPDEQKLVAHILSQLDRAIEQTEALIAKQQRIKTGLMQDLLTKGIDEHGNIRSEATHAFKDSPLGRIPAEWTPSCLGDVYSDSPRNGIYKPAAQIGEGVILVGQTSFTEERLIDYSQTRRTQVTESELRAYGLRAEDILVSRVFATVEGVGLPTFVHELPEEAVYESNMLRLRIDSAKAYPMYINYWLLSEPIIESLII